MEIPRDLKPCAAMAKSRTDHGRAWEARVALRVGDRAALESNAKDDRAGSQP